jgi:hypothetical protein
MIVDMKVALRDSAGGAFFFHMELVAGFIDFSELVH